MKIGFVDYSHEERNRILSTLKLLGDSTALDELGIGTVRDAYADILFPGISTLQTRAKYYVLVPYLFQNARECVEAGKILSVQDMMQWIRESEDKLAATLTTNCPGDVGIIGSNAFRNKRSVKIKPSMIYWNGLGVYGILRYNVSIASACKMLFSAAKEKAGFEIVNDSESFDDPTAADQGSSVFLPIKSDKGYEKNATMKLTYKEAEFLSDCILKHVPDSLLAFMISNKMVCDSLDSFPEDSMKQSLRRDYHLAKKFSRFIYGAHIRYNIIFSNYTDDNMMNAFEEWRSVFLASSFELEPVLNRVLCNYGLTKFCQEFLDNVIKNDTNAMDECIVRRELQVKNTRSKLRKPKEYRYDPQAPIHFYHLDYRYSRAKVIVRDILKGLECN